MAAPVLDIDRLRLDIGGAAVVDGLSLSVDEGEIVALVGESGCGKSLSALAVLRLLPDAVRLAGGRILLEGKDLASLDMSAMAGIRGRDASIIFQEPTASLDPLMPVGDQIAEALTAHRSVSAQEARRRAREMLVSIGISDPDRRLAQYPFELSGGMCQRIMIAIALICGPRLLIADEPTTALDVTIQAQILHLIRQLVAERGTAVLLITHDMGVVADIADRVVVMYAGRVAETATAEELFRAPRHPYTALLLASMPRAGIMPKSRLATIEGTVPPPSSHGAGCRFASRCPLVEDRCRIESPPLVDHAPGHLAACWRSDQVARLGAAA
ncbi:MAG: ABC transporter ATP-binding protein [Hyphomicrobiales bacterium]|nr:ABC transporter ATP-binding protein [Hyphomicrobiales bacterium]